MKRRVPSPGPLGVLIAAYAAGAALLLPKVRWQLNPDAISYIEIAERYAAAEPGVAVNALWSPLLSWVLTPLLAIGIDGLLAAKLVMFATGAALLIAAWMLITRMTSLASVRVIAVAALFLPALEWSAEVTAPDLLGAAIIVFFLIALFDPEALQRPKHAFATGLLGGLAYLAKSYAFPFVVSLLVLMIVVRAIRAARGTPAARSGLVPIAIVAMGFSTCALPWVAIVSLDTGRATIGTAGSYNLALTGPAAGAPETHDHPVLSGGLFAPTDEHYTSFWSDPSELRLQGWTGSRRALSHAAALIAFNLTGVVQFLWRVSPMTLPILFTGAILLLSEKTKGRHLLGWLYVSGTLYAAGYLLLHVEDRYLWLLPVLLLAILAAILDEADRRFPGQRRLLMVMAAVIALSFWIPSIGNLRDLRYVNRASALQAAELIRQGVDLSGKRVASDARWNETLYLGYHADFRYFGMPAHISSADRVRRELDEHQIDVMLVWGPPRPTPSYLAGWRRVALPRGSTPFSVFERQRSVDG